MSSEGIKGFPEGFDAEQERALLALNQALLRSSRSGLVLFEYQGFAYMAPLKLISGEDEFDQAVRIEELIASKKGFVGLGKLHSTYLNDHHI